MIQVSKLMKSLGASLLILITAASVAQAAQCGYRVKNAFGTTTSTPYIVGNGFAAKKKTACKRAKRQCMRRLQRHLKNHHGVGLGCVQVS